MKSILISLSVVFVFIIACGNPPNNPKKTLIGQQNINPTTTPTNTPLGGTTGTTTAGGTTGTTTAGGTTGTTTGTTTQPSGLTYTKDIKPIMMAHNCEICHTKYNNYDGVKAGIANIISRVANDNMPQNGTKLTPEKKKTLADWAATPGMPN